MTEALSGRRIHISGVVQGVGFRPFIFGLAMDLKLTGWVCNTSAGVDIEVFGKFHDLEVFDDSIKENAPPLARIIGFSSEKIPVKSFKEFEIIQSQQVEGAFQPISPDVSICDECHDEIFDKEDRHYRYPFTNCTKCGPRFTIIKDLPYDRPKTTMAGFEMCADCSNEYHDPLDRRFHAQPVACPACGPKIWLEEDGEILLEKEKALQAARNFLKEGKIIAVKGLGGFHLVCNATDTNAVSELRKRKHRIDKPFALMMADIKSVRKYCEINEKEEEVLLSIERPIVILDQKLNSPISKLITPGQKTLGVMLPYSPLHYLLLERKDDFPDALVMTSGNLREEPIAISNQDATNRLVLLADYFLMHNREIEARCDDSVLRIIETNSAKHIYPIRRSRGYSPFPVLVQDQLSPILATGAQLKNTFCLTRENFAFIGPHIGDLENYQTFTAFKKSVGHFEKLFKIRPEAIAHDLHPNYMTTKYAKERSEREGIPAFEVQHHHAHIAACMAENGQKGDRPVIGVSFDGTGYGSDGAIWGGEIMIADYSRFERVSHLEYIPMPGGEKAIQEPSRLALAWLDRFGLDWHDDLEIVKRLSEEEKRILKRQIKSEINSPLTSSMGRLFDAVSALADVRQVVNFEAQAAIELEEIVELNVDDSYSFDIRADVFSPESLIHSVFADIISGVSKSVISTKFHNGVAQMVRDVCILQKKQYEISDIVLSGGVWQNITLLSKTISLLEKDGFNVLIHRLVPANDGGIALGQAMIAAKLMQEV